MIVWTVWICLDWSLDIDWSDGFILVLFWCLETIFLSGSLLRWDYCGSEEWEAALSLSHTHTRATWCLMCLIRATAHWGPGHSSNQIPRGENIGKTCGTWPSLRAQLSFFAAKYVVACHSRDGNGDDLSMRHVSQTFGEFPVESVKAQWWKKDVEVQSCDSLGPNLDQFLWQNPTNVRRGEAFLLLSSQIEDLCWKSSSVQKLHL